MFVLKYDLEIFFLIIISTAVFFAVNNHKNQLNIATPIPKFVTADTAVPTPTSSPKPYEETVSWQSSDGNEKIAMKTQYIKKTAKTYSFFVSKTGENTDTPLFYETADSETSFSIPFNTFSPDDKYLFLKEDKKGENHYLVFNSSGLPFANQEKYIDITPLFDKYTSNYILSKVTGWASDTLLIIETKNMNGSPSTSFWFDVTTQSFTPLATRF